MFLRSHRLSHRDAALRKASFRPKVMLLEDRRAPGQTGVGSAVAVSLFGPALTAWQLDEMASSADVAGPRRTFSQAAAISIVQDDFVNPSLTAPDASPVEDHVNATPISGAMNSVSTAENLGGQAADTNQEVSIYDRRVAGATQIAPDLLKPAPGMELPPHDQGGERITLVGPNLITHGTTQCTGTTGKTQSETAVTHSGTNIVVAYNDSRGFYCGPVSRLTGWAFSTDRGKSWTEGGILTDVGAGVHHHGDPWLITGPDGSPYLFDLRVTNGFSLAGAYFQKGTFSGGNLTWSTPVAFGLNDGVDKEAATVDPTNGNIYMSFTRFSGGSGIWVYRSTDGGATFTGPTVVTSVANTQGSAPAIGPNGEVYVAWQNNNGFFGDPSGIGFARSLNNGASYTVVGNIATNTGAVISGTDRSPQFPQIAVDTTGGPNHGNIYITYHSSHLGGGTGHDALFIRSTDGGLTWSSPTRINDDGTNASQWFPTIKVDSVGFLHSFFYDRRGLAGSNTNLYYARSKDGGLTWEPNVKVTSAAFVTNPPSPDITPTFGDYINADTQGKSAMVAYADGRNGNADAFFTRVGNRD